MAKASPERDSGTGKATSGSGSRSTAKPAPGSKGSRARKPPPVITQAPRPWGWIVIAVVVAVFAAAAIGYAVHTVNKQEALADPNNIAGLQSKEFPSGVHVPGNVTYEESPPIGGEHDGNWIDCNGDVYTVQVRNENAVHGLEHGAVWITYDPALPQDQIDQLAELVDGQGYMFMSPYPGLSSPISLQAWGQQIFVDSVDDPRIEQFIRVFRQSPTNTPEPNGICDNPSFVQSPLIEGGEADATPAPSVTNPATPTTDPAATTAP